MDASTITVTAQREGFRRAGRAWSTKPVTVPLQELDEGQVKALVHDPALVVVVGGEKWDGTRTSAVLTPESLESGPPELDGPALTVTAQREGFRRAGRAWSTKPVTVPLQEFDEDQVDALRNDPNLVVVVHDTPIPRAASKGQSPERRSGRDDPDAPGRSGEDDPTAGTGSDDPPPGPGTGGGEAGARDQGEVRHAAIVAAIDQVPAHGRISTGAPGVDALERVLGFDVSAAERDAAWAEHQGGQAKS